MTTSSWDPNSPYAEAEMRQRTGSIPANLTPQQAQAYLDRLNSWQTQSNSVSMNGAGMMGGGSGAGMAYGQAAAAAASYGGGAGGGTSGSRYAPSGSGQARVEDARRRGYDLAGGRLDSLTNDPTDQMILDALTRRVNGDDVPYSKATTDAMFSDQAAQAGAAEAAQAQRVRGNPADPAYQAQLAELMAGRQANVMNGRRQIDMRANQANYDARGQAIGQTAGFNSSRQNRITDQGRYLTDMYRGESANSETPAYSYYGGGYGGGNYSSSGGTNYGSYGNQTSAPRTTSGAQSQTYSSPLPYSGPTGGGYAQLTGQPDTRIWNNGTQQLQPGQYGPVEDGWYPDDSWYAPAYKPRY